MTQELRRLVAADRPAADELGWLAFGVERQPSDHARREREGRLDWGLFDEGRLVAKATDRPQGHWFGGRVVPAAGIAGVVVAPEARGRGTAKRLMAEVLDAARRRGAVITTLFRTAPALYQRLGYEQVGMLTYATLPAAALAGVRVPAGLTLRAAGPADVPALLGVYRAVAEKSNGMLDRCPPLFAGTAEEVLGPYDGVTLAESAAGSVEGYVRWQRGPGYGPGARVTAHDALSLSEPATVALLAALGSWASVVETVALPLCDPDPLAMALPMGTARVEKLEPWMLRLLDAPGAMQARGWPPHISGSVDLMLEDELFPDNAGAFRLTVQGGAAELEPGGDATVALTARGLAALYASAASTAVLRRTGGLTGGSAETDAWLDAAFAGPHPAILDYF